MVDFHLTNLMYEKIFFFSNSIFQSELELSDSDQNQARTKDFTLKHFLNPYLGG